MRLLSLPQDENQVEGAKIDTVEEIQGKTQTVLNTLTKKDWDRCVRSQGGYFEGDSAE
jgi:hypothetical protein